MSINSKELQSLVTPQGKAYPRVTLRWEDNSEVAKTVDELVLTVRELTKVGPDSEPAETRKEVFEVRAIPGIDRLSERPTLEMRALAYGLRQRAQDANSAVTDGTKFDGACAYFVLFAEGEWSPEPKERAPRLTQELLAWCQIAANAFKAPLAVIQTEVLTLTAEQRQALEKRPEFQKAKAELAKAPKPKAEGILGKLLT